MPTLRQIMQDALQPGSAELNFSEDHIAARAASLRMGFDAIDAEFADRERLAQALTTLPEARRLGWLAGVRAAVSVTLSEARRGSRLARDAMLDWLPEVENSWNLQPALAGAVRGAPVSQLTATGAAGALQVVADDAGGVRRILVTISDFPADELPPVLLIISGLGGTPESREVDAEPATPSGAGVILRYQVPLPAGNYQIFLGNPRVPAGGTP
jgi:hypothetical protein